MMMPLGTYINARRTGDCAAAAGANAGTIASRNGKAIAVPAPFRKLLRGMYRPVTKVIGSELLSASETERCERSPAPGWKNGSRRQANGPRSDEWQVDRTSQCPGPEHTSAVLRSGSSQTHLCRRGERL